MGALSTKFLLTPFFPSLPSLNQIAGRAFDEAKREAMMMMPVPEGQEEADWDWWTMLGVERPKGGVWMEEWKRLETAVQVGR